MTATVRADGNRLALAGGVTADNVAGLRQQGEAWLASLPPASSAVVDLSAVASASSLLLSLLLCWQRAAVRQSLELSFSGAPEDLMALSRLNGVSRWLTGSR
ncbi:MAG: STAS domain-containing protein [Marinobacter sp.]